MGSIPSLGILFVDKAWLLQTTIMIWHSGVRDDAARGTYLIDSIVDEFFLAGEIHLSCVFSFGVCLRMPLTASNGVAQECDEAV